MMCFRFELTSFHYDRYSQLWTNCGIFHQQAYSIVQQKKTYIIVQPKMARFMTCLRVKMACSTVVSGENIEKKLSTNVCRFYQLLREKCLKARTNLRKQFARALQI